MTIIPAIIGGLGSLAGGLLGASSEKRALKQQNRQFQHQIDLVREQQFYEREQRKVDLARQSEEVRRRVRDAQAAGLHPLAALGFQGTGSSPIPAMPGLPGIPSSSSGNALGEGVARAAEFAAGAFTSAAQKERTELENELLRTQIAREKADTVTALSAARSRTAIATAASIGRSPPSGVPGQGPVEFQMWQPGEYLPGKVGTVPNEGMVGIDELIGGAVVTALNWLNNDAMRLAGDRVGKVGREILKGPAAVRRTFGLAPGQSPARGKPSHPAPRRPKVSYSRVPRP